MTELMNAKGVKDFPPREKILRNYVLNVMTQVFELYGYNPLETPILERFDVLASKYAGGAEILKETFKLEDQGGRELALRYDLTVPLARYMGMNPTIKMPFKRYQIDRVFRDGPVKLGRLREFWQCDIDTIGVKGMAAEAELLTMAQAVFAELGIDVEIAVNSRKILDGMMDTIKIESDELRVKAILALDKIKKQGKDAVVKEMQKAGVTEEQTSKLLEFVSVEGTSKEKLEALANLLQGDNAVAGLQEIEELFELLSTSDVTVAYFAPELARGLSYYTGPVYEIFVKDSEITSAIGAGGRWDNMISKFLQSKQEYPAVGISFGLELITEIMKNRENIPNTVTQVFIVPIGVSKEALKIVQAFRQAGINADMDMMGRGVSKNLDYASKAGIPFVAMLGKLEIGQSKIKIKNMNSGDEEVVFIEEAIEMIKKVSRWEGEPSS